MRNFHLRGVLGPMFYKIFFSFLAILPSNFLTVFSRRQRLLLFLRSKWRIAVERRRTLPVLVTLNLLDIDFLVFCLGKFPPLS